MRIDGFIWLDQIIDKLISKHSVETYEVEEVFTIGPKFRFVEKGERNNEDVYMALGQSDAGRYLIVLFIRKKDGEALILSARDMAAKEKRIYERNNKTLPKFESLDLLTDFFDNNDMGSYLDSMPEVAFDVEIKGRRPFVAVDEEVADQISAISRQEHVPSGAIVDSWLREKISDYSPKA